MVLHSKLRVICRALVPAVLLAMSLQACAEFALIPAPKEQKDVRASLINRGIALHCESSDPEDRFAATDLRAYLLDRGLQLRPSGIPINLLRSESARGHEALRASRVQWDEEKMGPEGYVIVPAGSGIAVIATSATGLFYGAQTAKQLIDSSVRPAVLHVTIIRDWPTMKIRGLSDDLSRGPVPTLDFLKKQIRTFAEYKMNLYSPYFEHTFQYASNPLIAPVDGAITAAEGRELVAYAARFHVSIAPEQEAFGHLHNVLKWELYAPLAETPHGQVLAPGDPGSFALARQMFSELAEVFPGPYLHIGADETQELGKGRTSPEVQRRGLASVYLDYLQRLATELKPLHRTLLFWGDIAVHNPELLRALPDDFKKSTIAVVWEYNAHPEGFARFLRPFRDAEMQCWVSPGVNNWSRVYPNFSVALSNIQALTAEGQADGCTGQLNTVWNDDGEALFNANWYCVLFGAAAAWQEGPASIPAFDSAYGRVFHSDSTGKVVEAQHELMQAQRLLSEQYKRADASDSMFWVDPWSVDGQRIAPLIRTYLPELRLHAERAMVLVREVRSQPGVRETDALDVIELGARRLDLMAYKFQLSDEISAIYSNALAAHTQGAEGREQAARDLQSLDSTNGKLQDLRDGYTECREMYKRAWGRSYRDYWLENNLARYNMAIELWLSRIDAMRSAQRQLMYDHTLPSAAALGIPARPSEYR